MEQTLISGFLFILGLIIGHTLRIDRDKAKYELEKDLQTRPKRLEIYQLISSQLKELSGIFYYEREAKMTTLQEYKEILDNNSQFLIIDDENILSELWKVYHRTFLYNEKPYEEKGNAGDYMEECYQLIINTKKRIDEIAQKINK